ncbi:MAG: DUF1549 domain-containing protein [Candidatus Solibacter usitatus]|nr:DUF1549 domain-containing protein [Candidatus Solibacter usitatus]
MQRLVWLMAASIPAAAQSTDFFEKQIRPVLIQRCFACHSAASKPLMGGLRLDTRELVLKGGARGAAVIPGNAQASMLMSAVRHASNLRMPPAAKLPEAEIAALSKWIQMGAPWGRDAVVQTKSETFWAFVPPQEPSVPAVKNQNWAKTPIDRFVLAKLEAKGLKPAPPANKRALLRRVTFDLIGLPPTTDEMDAFLKDDSPAAFAKVVDRLLASPRYGERWGRHWLDVARYADSNGLDENLVFLQAWRYRDYVISAFNKDKPYNLFIQEQLAGDLLPKPASEDEYYERLTATGFLSLGGKMLAEDDQLKMEMDIVDEQVEATSKAFLGLTTGCARCHDHKFDPIPTNDYYSLAGIFKSTKTMENFKVVAVWHEHVLAPEADRERLRQHQKRVEAKNKEITAVRAPANQALQREARSKLADYLIAANHLHKFEKTELTPLAEQAPVNLPANAKLEWTADVARAGEYQLDIRYQSSNGSAVKLFVNGELVKSNACAKAFLEPTWRGEGVFALNAGTNTIRLERAGKQPEVKSLSLSPASLTPEATPRTPEQLALVNKLNPDFITKMADYLARNWDSPNSVFHEWYLSQRTLSDAQTLAAKFRTADEAWSKFRRSVPGAKKLLDVSLEPYREALYDPNGPFATPQKPERYYSAETAKDVARLESELKEIEKAAPVFPRAMGVTEGKIENLRVNIRGNHISLGEERPRQFLSALSGASQTPIDNTRSGRLDLAQWLTGRANPLTARVMANRVWRWHFGAGIVRSVDNFGKLGEAPDNQPLLDWLALRFIESGWSVKSLHRLMLLSNTYQMSSAHDEKAFEKDPENRSQWHFARRRLEGEEIRDSIFAVSGGLNAAIGGGSLKAKDRQYVNHRELDYTQPRRAVYMPIIRSGLYDVLQTFDYGDPAVGNGDRATTNVAPQALFMMNGSVVLEESLRWARALLKDHPDDSKRLNEIFRRALNREPTPLEKDRALSHLARAKSMMNSDDRAWQSLCRAIIGTNEFVFVD